ncbi:sodium:solute symporter family protein [Amphritea sp. 1_MG-2023]|uniref:sodium:solute symporter family protein n=1 Tax=Amphritea sp. 1_MG-2023 TaxID=3062670 RepID=UPI0026E44ABC|nr:sodium:solute symporter family protein [Amphritea sp. 1_MG-2023]MDO6563827.1 sodium:solute symporter family protein [Amphritea sp. 1_MG-2023]
MFSSLTVILIVTLYMAVLFAIAQMVERRISHRGEGFKGPWIYALSLAVYHTSWTFYGSVGFAASAGLQYLGVYLGAMLGIACWWIILKRMVHAKETFHITSIADFISTRYNRSEAIAALVTVMALFGILPYIALQLKALTGSFQLITEQQSSAVNGDISGLLITLFMIAFTIMFGMRRLDPTERHQGMMTALAVECLVKLVAFIAVGCFVSFSLFNGFDDITEQLFEQGFERVIQVSGTADSGVMWLTLIVLSFAAIQNLPRMFHVAVVENADIKHIKTAIWVLPLYMILINLFVVPIAAGGLLMGLPEASADFYVLLLPQLANNNILTMLAFIGGFSAATGMIIITTMTLSTMAANHLLVPIIERVAICRCIKPYLLQLRWLLAGVILLSSYGFSIEFSDAYILVAIGLISFVAVLQFSPALLGGLFWRRGNSAGAFAGLLAGFLMWVYTLLIPAFIEHGWLDSRILQEGLLGLSVLRPEALFGLEHLGSIPHSVVWTLLVNISFYILGSLLYSPHKVERSLSTEFLSAMHPVPFRQARPTGLDRYIPLSDKLNEAQTLLEGYLSSEKAKAALTQMTEDLQVSRKSHIAIIELLEFHRMLEHTLAGSIGSASAHKAVESNIRYNERESADLKALYKHLVTELNQHPEDAQQTHATGMQNYGLINSLQNKVKKYEHIIGLQDKRIAGLTSKLEARDKDIFRYRLETQKVRLENETLKREVDVALNIDPPSDTT